MPKTYRNLWPQLISFANLWQAYHAARRGKRARPAVAAYDFDAETRLLRLQERLAEGSYTPGPYRTFAIREWKRRIISAAPFEDRIVHHALCQVIEPIWEARLIHSDRALWDTLPRRREDAKASGCHLYFASLCLCGKLKGIASRGWELRSAMPESPIFARCDELVLWVLRATVRYPRHYRAALGKASQEAALGLQRALIAAARRRDKRSALQAADEALHELRVLIRQGQALGLLTVSQLEHAARLLDEIGRLIGGWRKSLARAAGGEAAE